MSVTPYTDLEQQDIDDIDEYLFWGIIQTDGEVCPVNIDHCIYYTDEVVEDAPSAVGTELHVDHISSVGGVDEVAKIGEVVDEKQLNETRFGLFKFERDLWEQFVDAVIEQLDVEDENDNIPPGFNQMVEDIDGGNLALSAGLGVSLAETPIHDFTVQEIRGWNEVSIVGKPASPGSHAWPCDDVCGLVFGEQTMSAQTLNVDLEAIEQAAEDGTVPTQVVEVMESDEWGEDIHGIQFTADGEAVLLDDEDEIVQYDCSCATKEAELRQELKEVREERNNLKTLVQEIEQDQREKAAERLRKVNQKLPEDEQYGDEELDEIIEESSIKHLNQMADMVEKAASLNEEETIEEGKEDLTGTGQKNVSEEEAEQLANTVDSVAKQMFGKSMDEINQEIESGTFGDRRGS